MEKNFGEEISFIKRFDNIIPLVQLFIALSLAFYAVSMGILLSIGVLAIDSTNMDEIWLQILVITFLCTGAFLLLAIILTFIKEPKMIIRSFALVLIPLLILGIGGLSIYLRNNFFGFKDYYSLAHVYGSYFKDQMLKVTTGIFWISILAIAEIFILAINKLFTKQFKDKLFLYITAGLSLFSILPIEIIGLAIAKDDTTHTFGIKLFFSAIICLAVISLVIHLIIIKEINEIYRVNKNTNRLKQNSITELKEETNSHIEQQFSNLQWNKSAILLITIGAISLIAGIIWLMITATNERLVHYSLWTIPRSAFPEMTLSSIGTVLMVYGLFLKQKNSDKHKAKLLSAAILLALIIPTKIFTIFIIWFIQNKIPYNRPFGWDTSLKGFFIVITDLLPIILAQFLINYSVKDSKNKKWFNIWILVSSIIILITVAIYMLIVIWPKLVGEVIDFSIWLGVYRNTSIISIIALANLIAINLVNTIKNRGENLS